MMVIGSLMRLSHLAAAAMNAAFASGLASSCAVARKPIVRFALGDAIAFRSFWPSRWLICRKPWSPVSDFKATDSLNVASRSEEHTSELQAHRYISYAVFC